MVFCGNKAALPGDNHFTKSKPNPISCSVRAFPAMKAVKQAGQIFFLKAGAVVAYA
jgi:hypothetical protein